MFFSSIDIVRTIVVTSTSTYYCCYFYEYVLLVILLIVRTVRLSVVIIYEVEMNRGYYFFSDVLLIGKHCIGE